MEKQELGIENFISDIDPHFSDVVYEVHRLLTGQGCTVKLQQAKSGHVVSYNHPASKKAVANLVTRKTGPVIRIYGDGAAGYTGYLETMPDVLEKRLAKASACRRMLDPTKCNARCPMGYDLTLKGERHQKCRYNCFMFPLTVETLPFITGMLTREMQARSA